MADYEFHFNNARRRYQNASSEITSTQNRITSLGSQRQQGVNEINRLRAEIRNHEEALEKIEQMLTKEASLDQGIARITNSMNPAATNYLNMIRASNVTSKNLNQVYDNAMQETKRTLSSTMSRLRAERSSLRSKIADLQNQLRRAEAELERVNNSTRSAQSSLQSLNNSRRNASIDMEFYRRRMNQAS